MLWLDHVVLLCLSRFHSLVSEVFLVHFSFPLVFICLPYILAMCAASRWVRDLSLDFFSCPACQMPWPDQFAISQFFHLPPRYGLDAFGGWLFFSGFSLLVSEPSSLFFSFAFVSFVQSRRQKNIQKKMWYWVYIWYYMIYTYTYIRYIYIWYLAWSKLFLNL